MSPCIVFFFFHKMHSVSPDNILLNLPALIVFNNGSLSTAKCAANQAGNQKLGAAGAPLGSVLSAQKVP